MRLIVVCATFFAVVYAASLPGDDQALEVVAELNDNVIVDEKQGKLY